jgi:sarcosine oxidase gamma subunit
VLLLPPVSVPPPANLVIAKLKNCRRVQARAATAAAAEVAVAAAAAVDVAVASTGLTYDRDLAPDCWVLLRANSADSAEAAVAALKTSSGRHQPLNPNPTLVMFCGGALRLAPAPKP